MGFIRSGLLSLVGILLFLSFLAGNFLLTLDLSLKYDNVKPEISLLVQDFVEKEANITNLVEQKLEFMKNYCLNNTEFVFEAEDYAFTIPCDSVYLGKEKIIEAGVDNFIHDLYYKEYDCNFWNCATKDIKPFVFVSKKAKDYWHSKFRMTLLAILSLIVLLFLLVEHKPNTFIVCGALLTLSTLLFRKIDLLASFFGETFSQFFYIFFSEANTVFLVSVVIGIVALGLGIVFRILSWESIKKKFSKKQVQEIVKKEVQKNKEELKKKKK